VVAVRSSLYLVFLFATIFLWSLPLSLIGWLLPQGILGRIGRLWGRLNLRALARICGLSYRIAGADHLRHEPCIVLCKHQSAWETIALRALLSPEHTWVLKRELLWIPFFGWGIAPFRPIAIDRKAGRRAMRQVLEDGIRALTHGRTVVIFPEGTRVAPGQRRRYGLGGALLAERSGFPVIPIAHNAGVFWRRRDLRKYPGVVDVVIGAPLRTEGLAATEINRQVEEWIETTVASLPGERSLTPAR